MTPGSRRYGENRFATMQRKNIADALAGKTPIMQKVWMKALRHLIAFATTICYGFGTSETDDHLIVKHQMIKIVA